MRYREEPNSECMVCKRKERSIAHNYSRNGEAWAEFLHHNGNGGVIVCWVSICVPIETFMMRDHIDYDKECEKERTRRQKHWKRRHLPQRFINHSTVPLIGADDHGETRNNPVTDDAV
jgi:hypothetical protein